MTVSEEWIVAAARDIEQRRRRIWQANEDRARRHSRRQSAAEVERIERRAAVHISQAEIRAEKMADENTGPHCAQCGASVTYHQVECNECHTTLDPDAVAITVGQPLGDTSMYEPSRLPLTVPIV